MYCFVFYLVYACNKQSYLAPNAGIMSYVTEMQVLSYASLVFLVVVFYLAALHKMSDRNSF